MARSAKAGDHVAQGTVVHIEYALPVNRLPLACSAGVVEVVLQESRQDIVGRSNGVKITIEVQVNVYRRFQA
jgi:hypothetical protein